VNERDNTTVLSAGRWSGFARALGPGIMYAGAAIGVSHLVQATKAGAGYGFALVWAVVIVHLLKYPFFEYAYRYVAATGDSLLVGYRRLGRWALVTFLVVAFCLSIPTTALLTLVTAGMASQLFTANLSALAWVVILLGACTVLLASGGYSLLDKVMKVLMVFLALCTLGALLAAIGHGRAEVTPGFVAPEIFNVAGIGFLVALMGWMPTPIDASVWPSLWMQARARQTGHRPRLHEALFDFRLGYVGTLVMALMFLSLGSLIMFGTGEKSAAKAGDFAAQFVRMYTSALGSWSRIVIVTAAFATMFSTLLMVLDGYPRVLTAGTRLLQPSTERFGNAPHWVFMALMMGGALLVFVYVTSVMGTLVRFTMTVAFLSAPLFAYLNCRALTSPDFPPEAAPPRWLVGLSWLGLAFLICFSILFLIVHFGYGS